MSYKKFPPPIDWALLTIVVLGIILLVIGINRVQ